MNSDPGAAPARTARRWPRLIAVGESRQVAGAERARDQADAVEHDARGAAAVDDVLQRRLAARRRPFRKPARA